MGLQISKDWNYIDVSGHMFHFLFEPCDVYSWTLCSFEYCVIWRGQFTISRPISYLLPIISGSISYPPLLMCPECAILFFSFISTSKRSLTIRTRTSCLSLSRFMVSEIYSHFESFSVVGNTNFHGGTCFTVKKYQSYVGL